jgi:hypothetical protein
VRTRLGVPGDAFQRGLNARGGGFRIVGLARHACQALRLGSTVAQTEAVQRGEGQVSGRPSVVIAQRPAVIVHSAADARLALSVGQPLTLLSAPGAALYAGCGWWQALVRQARVEFSAVPMADILDCGGSAGQALAALRIRQRHLVLSPAAPGWDAVAAIAAEQGGSVLHVPPSALDLARRGAAQRLHDWLRNHILPGDSEPPLG